VLEAGEASVAFAVTDRDGISALDIGRGPTGDGYVYLRRALAALVAGRTSHGGALLGPLSVRFVVARVGDLPPVVRDRLDAQLDLDLEPAGGLVVFRNARALPTAVATTDPTLSPSLRRSDLDAISRMPPLAGEPLRAVEGGWVLPPAEGPTFVSTEFDDGWRADPGGSSPFRAFGWALASPTETTALRYDAQWERTAQIAALAALWIAVLWITRRPATRGAEVGAP
jgi:hypothetical protein